MVNLNDYESYWNSIKERIPEIGKIIPIRTDPDMADEIQSLSSADLPALFVILHLAMVRLAIMTITKKRI